MTPLPWEEERRTTVDFISDVCGRIDDAMNPLPNHPQAAWWPREGVTLGVRQALQGVGHRAF